MNQNIIDVAEKYLAEYRTKLLTRGLEIVVQVLAKQEKEGVLDITHISSIVYAVNYQLEYEFKPVLILEQEVLKEVLDVLTKTITDCLESDSLKKTITAEIEEELKRKQREERNKRDRAKKNRSE